MDEPIKPAVPAESREIGSFFIRWHFFAPFFAGVLGLLVAFVFLFLTSTHRLFDFYKQRQERETLATVQDAMAKRQQYLHSYLSFIRDDVDFKNAFYYAGEDIIALKKPLAEYLRKHRPLLGWEFVEAATPAGRVIHSEWSTQAQGRRAELARRRLSRSPDRISTELALIGRTPYLVAHIPAHLFGKLTGHLTVGFDFGLSFLQELREITRHDFILLDADGKIAVSTIEDDPLQQRLAVAAGNLSAPFSEVSADSRNYFLSQIPILNPEREPFADMRLYVVGDLSDLEAFRRRIIRTALLLFVVIGAAGFLFSVLSSRTLSTRVNRLLLELQKSRGEVERRRKLSALGELAAQISHDIRSPLAALDSVAGNIAHLPEDQRLIVRSAVGRIRDIANQLLGTSRAQPVAESAESRAGETDVYLLSSLLEAIVTEKRLQFRARLGVEITAALDASSYGHFARLDPREFKRVLSNLIDNGVEAIQDRGNVTILLTGGAGMVELKVEDDGAGIPPEVLGRLGRRGETYGKPGGSGLGLHHARTSAESWIGTLEIQSTVGEGTTVTVRLPAASPPGWFVSRLEIAPGSPLVVLDDDPTIHQIWQRRIEALAAGESGVRILHFSHGEALRTWAATRPSEAREAVYLLDYELRGSPETGLTLARELDLGDRAILVTSRFEEKEVMEECLRLGIRMIPKGLAGFVPFILRLAEERPDAVLIDDDHLVHTVWKVAARTNGKRLDTFSTPREFLAIVGRLDKRTPIYVDSKLGEGLRGEDFAKELHAQGFRNLYLATGHQRQSLPAMPWIKEVVGKKAPWES